MRIVIGTYPAPTHEGQGPLAPYGRIVVDYELSPVPGAYADLIDSTFRGLARENPDLSRTMSTDYCAFPWEHLSTAIIYADATLKELRALPQEWTALTSNGNLSGTMRRIPEPLKRRRLFAIIRLLRAMFARARRRGHSVVYATGPAAEHLLRKPVSGRIV